MRSLPMLDSRSAILETAPPRPAWFGDPELPRLTDAQHRSYTYLRLSVTDRCDLACIYCMPPQGEDEHAQRTDLLTFEEAAHVVSSFALLGIERVRFTGGEPLVRKDIVRMIELVHRRSGLDNLVMTTNAMRLAELARPLKDAGLTGVNVSIDSLDATRFRELTRGGELGCVLAGIDAALDAGLSVKLNVVALRGLNDHEFGPLVDFAWDRNIVPRFIEMMPIGEASKLPRAHFIDEKEIIELLGTRLARTKGTSVAKQGPARYIDAADGSARRVGFITAMSHTFCDSCNRVRVTARGDIRACLASRRAASLRDPIRFGASDIDLAWMIHWALSGKSDGHFFLDKGVHEHEHVGMSLIGG